MAHPRVAQVLPTVACEACVFRKKKAWTNFWLLAFVKLRRQRWLPVGGPQVEWPGGVTSRVRTPRAAKDGAKRGTAEECVMAACGWTPGREAGMRDLEGPYSAGRDDSNEEEEA